MQNTKELPISTTEYVEKIFNDAIEEIQDKIIAAESSGNAEELTILNQQLEAIKTDLDSLKEDALKYLSGEMIEELYDGTHLSQAYPNLKVLFKQYLVSSSVEEVQKLTKSANNLSGNVIVNEGLAESIAALKSSKASLNSANENMPLFENTPVTHLPDQSIIDLDNDIPAYLSTEIPLSMYSSEADSRPNDFDFDFDVGIPESSYKTSNHDAVSETYDVGIEALRGNSSVEPPQIDFHENTLSEATEDLREINDVDYSDVTDEHGEHLLQNIDFVNDERVLKSSTKPSLDHLQDTDDSVLSENSFVDEEAVISKLKSSPKEIYNTNAVTDIFPEVEKEKTSTQAQPAQPPQPAPPQPVQPATRQKISLGGAVGSFLGSAWSSTKDVLTNFKDSSKVKQTLGVQEYENGLITESLLKYKEICQKSISKTQELIDTVSNYEDEELIEQSVIDITDQHSITAKDLNVLSKELKRSCFDNKEHKQAFAEINNGYEQAMKTKSKELEDISDKGLPDKAKEAIKGMANSIKVFVAKISQHIFKAKTEVQSL